MNIILDLDNTLIDTQQFKNRLSDLFNEIAGVNFVKTYNFARFDNTYNYSKHLEIVEKLSGFSRMLSLNKRVMSLLDVTSMMLFDDVENFLERFKNEKIFLVTRGEAHFQWCKIDGLGIRIRDIFEDIHVVTAPKDLRVAGVVNQYRSRSNSNSFFIDSDPEELLRARVRCNN